MKYNDIIYFDNAATTRKKPEVVHDAFNYFIREIGASPGRGSHVLAIESSRMLYQSRKTVSNFFGCPNIKNTIFTKNATEAANLFLRGYLNKGDHVIISPFEHNSILRPIHQMMEEGLISYDVLKLDGNGNVDLNMVEELINDTTKLAIVTLGSNITGKIIFNSKISKYLHGKGIRVLVDTAQGAGRHDINMLRDNVDYLIFTGHKDLYGLPGTGGLCSLNELNIRPLLQGGTGVHAEIYNNPDIAPEKYEAGTPNMASIWSLKAGIEYVQHNIEVIKSKENSMYKFLIDEMKKIPSIIIYGDDSNDNLPIVSFNLEGMDCQEVGSYLSNHNVCVRTGLHCSVLGHEAIGTSKIGVVRVSLDYHNTIEEIEWFINLLKTI